MNKKISLITPFFEPDETEFLLCASSISAQTHKDFEWIVVDDGSTTITAHDLLSGFEFENLKIISLPENQGRSEATNVGIEASEGDFVTFLDQDDMLQVNAVEVLSEVVEKNIAVDIIYSDEDKIDDENNFVSPFRKPDWSPERLRHQNYFNHLTAIRKTLVNEVGRLRPEFDGSQDYDLVLRCSEKARYIHHIPEVLYHWRASSSSVAKSPEAKPYAHLAAVRAVEEHLQRSEISASVQLNENYYLNITRTLNYHPLVSILIPSCGSFGHVGGEDFCLVQNCIESIINLSTYENFEIIVVLDEDSSDEARDFLENISDPRLKITPYYKPFNYSEKINVGYLESEGDVLLLLNDDVEVIEPNWIEDMLVYLEESDVGIVAPTLLLEDGRIQSAGHFNDRGVHHLAAGLLPDEPGPFGLLTFPSERSSVTFACAVIRRELFEELGGLDEEFPRAFNDVDFCFRATFAGKRILCTSRQTLRHFESLSRDPNVETSEVELLYRLWGNDIQTDVYLPKFWDQLLGY